MIAERHLIFLLQLEHLRPNNSVVLHAALAPGIDQHLLLILDHFLEVTDLLRDLLFTLLVFVHYVLV